MIMAAGGEARQYDLVVYGATGYTGKFVAEEVYRIQTEGRRPLKWAAAGRNESKVRRALQDLGIEGVDVLTADSGDQASLEAMCASTRALVNCVGPYTLYGEPVIQACISHKCDYVDITGENLFIETLWANYSQPAKKAGVYIVNACGYDSIPNDIGSLVLQKAFNGQLVYVESFMSIAKGRSLNTGTWKSFLRSVRGRAEVAKLRRANPKPALPMPDVIIPRRRAMFFDEASGCYFREFPGPDKSIVMQSQQYRYEKDETPPFRFKPYFAVASNLLSALVTMIGFLLILPLALTDFGLYLLETYPAFFSFGRFKTGGPNRNTLGQSTFKVILDGVGYSVDNTERSGGPDASMRVTVRGAEPAYVATSAMLVQSAMCLINERDKLPPGGGVFTPAAAFGETNIVRNLEDTGKVRFEISQA